MNVIPAVVFLSLFIFTGLPYGFCEELYTVPEDIINLMDEGKFDQARERLEKYRRKAPDNPLAIFYLARLEKDFNKAVALFKEVEILADSSLASEAVAARAELLFSGGDITAAENLYTKIISDYPFFRACTEAHYRLGVIKLVSGSPDQARIHFELCLKENPDDNLRVLAATGIMESYAAMEEWPEVMQSARTVLETTNDDNPVTPRVLEVIARSWREMGNSGNADYYTERLLKNYPESYQAHAIHAGRNSTGTDEWYSFESESTGDDSLRTSDDVEETGSDTDDIEVSENMEKTEYTVQASAFRDKNNALKLHQRLTEEGFDSRISMKTFADKHVYLFQIGHYNTREKAENAASRVTEFIGIKAIIISLDSRKM